MKLFNSSVEIFVPDGTEIEVAIKRTTHMAIGAHQDDLEIMAYHGIEACFQSEDLFFFGCVVTNGAGSARGSIYQNFTDEEMIKVRREEQIKAAQMGKYGALASLGYPSREVNAQNQPGIVEELTDLIRLAQPRILYTHNLADKHDTHIGVVTKVIKAIRMLPKELRPKQVYGCEVWRNLDWLNDEEKIFLNVSGHPNLALSLIEVFESQIIGGKRYDLGIIGRRLSNATFNASHKIDETSALTYAMDLTPLIEDDLLDIRDYVTKYIDQFKQSVLDKINKIL